ncbi:MAG TPA: beta-ketoacyl-[acyl-carrier-protein] synthase family protein [Fulvivirga sp.]|nr:beta-ketoacyl-[acyl-carrier-protein] synthase family protein [Fulvivirga sp.]
MSKRVFISGYGIISALGFDAGQNRNALKNLKPGIGKPNFLKTRQEVVVGEVDASNEQLTDMAALNGASNISRTALLGLIATKEAIQMAGLNKDTLIGTGLLNGTSVGGMDISERAFGKVLNGQSVDYKASFAGHDCGHSTQFIVENLGVKGYNGTISTACSSSANTLMHGANLIKSSQLDCVIAGGTDALSMFTLNGFNSLKILDSEWCRPFDQNRMGLNLGEGAAFLVLESEEHLKARNGKALAELIGYGNANDAYHQTASSPDGKGAFNAIKTAMEVAAVKPEQISYINAHGTGTANNDQSESLALQTIFGKNMPPYSSTKAFTGHTLGAAGGIEAVFSVMAIEQQVLLPSLNVKQPMDIIAAPNKEYKSAKVETVLSNSFGFGGNCSSLIFAQV